ncbi:MAG: enoyl-CoA hydratase-related protein [Actinomycetes bacterium]
MSEWIAYDEYENIELLRNGAAARIVLNRPHALNAWDSGIGADLKDAIARVETDTSIRAVEIRGAGRAFSSGADLKEGFSDLDENGAPNLEKALHDRYHPVMLGIRRMPKPVLASVHGPAVGVACSMALACDLVLASESAYFLLSFASIGLVPDGGASAFIPARAGFSRASEMALLAERVSGTQAAEWGLVNRLVSDDEFEAASDALILKLSKGATSSYAGAKAQLNASCFPNLEAQLALEATLQQGQAASADFREGVTAFLEGRDARFGED